MTLVVVLQGGGLQGSISPSIVSPLGMTCPPWSPDIELFTTTNAKADAATVSTTTRRIRFMQINPTTRRSERRSVI